MIFLCIFLSLYLVHSSEALLCYNGTFTHSTHGEDPVTYEGLFWPSPRTLARNRCWLTVSCEDNAMCFVRSWQARAKYAWIVQRGCYHSSGRNDSLPKLLNVPTRAMSCTHRRLSEAEYRVCLCRADWCNLASSLVQSQYFIAFISIIVYLLSF